MPTNEFSGESRRILSRELTTCTVSSDGKAVELGFLDWSAKSVFLQLTFDQAQSIVMTLPHLLSQALKKRTGSENSRYVFRIGSWSIEGAENQDCLIVTLATADGFEVSLGIAFDACRQLGANLHDRGEKAVEAVHRAQH